MTEHKGFGKRWIGAFPKIGIRPTIDGRMNGVREILKIKKWAWQNEWLPSSLKRSATRMAHQWNV